MPEARIELGTTPSNGQCEARLKTDMMTTLSNIQLEIENKKANYKIFVL